MNVTVLVTLLNDPRVARTLASLQAQTRVPDRVIIADGGSRDATLDAVRPFLADPAMELHHLPGSVAETRNAALDLVAEEDEGILVFLDADQVAPPRWLAALVAPLEAGRADAAGGPTRALGAALSSAEAYVNGFEAWFYERVLPHDPTTLPMGNSAWRSALLREVGGFDPALVWGGEDWDVNLRVARAGGRFEIVPDAWVYHDQAHLRSIPKLVRRKYRYSVGATVAYLKNGALGRKVGPAVRTSGTYPHPLEWANLALKPVALVHGWVAWRRMGRGRRR